MGILRKHHLLLLSLAYVAMTAIALMVPERARGESQGKSQEESQGKSQEEPEGAADDGSDERAEESSGERAAITPEDDLPTITPEGDSSDDASEEEHPVFRAHGERARGITALQPGDPSLATTRIELDGRLASGEELREVLAEIPSARVSSSGGDGQYAALGLRGTEFNHSVVLLGDMRLSGPETGAFDLSQLPLSAFEAVEVHRGGAPTIYGITPIGGALRLIPSLAGPSRLRASLGAGSFGTVRAGLGTRISQGKFRFGADVGLARSKNDYPYLDDGNTAFDPSDDRDRPRENADFMRGHGFFAADYRHKNTVIDASALLIGFGRGEPGAASKRTQHSRTNLHHAFFILGVTHHGELGKDRAYRLRAAVSSGFERRRFTDVFGELGQTPADTDDRLRVVEARVAGSVDLTRFLELNTSFNARFDRLSPEDALAHPQVLPGERDTVSGAIEARFHGRLGSVPVEARPSVHLEWARGSAPGFDATDAAITQHESLRPSLRLGLAAGVHRSLSLVGSVYQGARNPTLLELFGDRGRFLPNPKLIHERALGGDAGFIARVQRERLVFSLEARAFALRMSDLIDVYTVSAQGQVKAYNRGEATIVGAELGARLEAFDHLRLIVAMHGLRAEHESGRELPNRPRFIALSRAEGFSGRLSKLVHDLAGFVEVNHIGGTFFDPGNLIVYSPRTHVDLGFRGELFTRGLSIYFTVRDLLDERGMDFARSPLPGRRLSFTLSYQTEFQ